MTNYKNEEIDDFVVENVNLIPFLFNKYWRWQLDDDHLLNELIEDFMPKYIAACKNYDSSLHTSFSTYLTACIENYMKDYFDKTKAFKGKSMGISNGFSYESVNGYSKHINNIKNQMNGLPAQIILISALDYVKETQSNRNYQIFYNRFILGYQNIDLARAYNLHPKTISNIISKIIRSLRLYFEY